MGKPQVNSSKKNKFGGVVLKNRVKKHPIKAKLSKISKEGQENSQNDIPHSLTALK